jgi:hypothetical protein
VKYPDKLTWEVVYQLLNDLIELQFGLLLDLYTPTFYINKVIIICQGHPAYQLAITNPLEEPGQFMNKLRLSITIYEKE